MEGAERERLLLADCYRRAMTRAVTSGCKSIAFPLIFSGEYHIPREEAIYIAGQAITDFIRRSPALDVVLVLYKPGIYLMAKRILGWDDTHSYGNERQMILALVFLLVGAPQFYLPIMTPLFTVW